MLHKGVACDTTINEEAAICGINNAVRTLCCRLLDLVIVRKTVALLSKYIVNLATAYIITPLRVQLNEKVTVMLMHQWNA